MILCGFFYRVQGDIWNGINGTNYVNFTREYPSSVQVTQPTTRGAIPSNYVKTSNFLAMCWSVMITSSTVKRTRSLASLFSLPSCVPRPLPHHYLFTPP